MEIVRTDIPDVLVLQPRVFRDERGFFMESYNRVRWAEHGVDADFVMDAHSRSGQWVLRGMHYQRHNTQGKLLRVLSGAIYDVAVDLRRSSPTFGRWVGAELSAENFRQIWVPPGFAHGFLTLTEDVQVAYKCTNFYSPEHERTLAWNAPEVGIRWPLPEGVVPQLSDKDQRGATLADADTFD